MKKICPNCGAEAEGNFCPECGTNLTDVAPQVEPDAKPETPAAKPEEPIVQPQEQNKEPEKVKAKAEIDKFEELKRFKELLDSGIITQEEFDKKKAELLAAPAESKSAGAKVLNGFLSTAKEKSEQAKVVANEKLEELKKKQQEDAEKRKREEAERKENQAELEKQKAEQAKLLEEQKKKAAEEKRLKAEEKLRLAEEKKEQNKQKRKAFFAKKSVKAVIGIICGLIIAFIAFCIYAYVSRDTIKDDFSSTTPHKLHGLEYEVPANWETDTNGVINPDSQTIENEAYVRYDKDNGSVLGAANFSYFGDDLDIDELSSGYSSDKGWEEYSLSGTSDNMKVLKKSEDGLDEFVLFADTDYSAFGSYVSVASSAYDEAVVNSILTSPKFDTYKNPAEAESLEIKYLGDKTDGYVASEDDFEVTVKYKDGTSSAAKAFTINPASPTVNNGKATTVTIKCHGLEDSIELKGKQVDTLSASYSGSTEEGEVIKKGSPDLTVTVTWDDGTTDTVTDYEMDSEITLEAGETGEATISAFGKSTTLSVQCSTMSESQYKDACETRGYKDLLREASYDEYTKIYGKVVQDCGSGYYRITSGGSAWDDVYMVTVLSGDTLVEDDWVTCYGVTMGIYSYETVMGATQKVPWLSAKYVDFD